MTQRLLLVEQSATMRIVMAQHAHSLGFAVDACESFDEAERLLDEQFQQYGAEYSVILFGWPTTEQEDALAFSSQLESDNHREVPVVVMSTDMRAETRAWVAAREHSALLSWKKYQDLGGVLTSLIDVAPSPATQASLPSKHRGVHLLIVDDSATIRSSLKDLFESQGYRVTLAATYDEAMAAATSHRIDIAILDYYLANTTGDVLCRDLIASKNTGDIVCTVLTGTYSDAIIKQSLQAGALECMFKNESSSLLLARIDAISQLAWNSRKIRSEHRLLESVLQSIAGAVILVGFDQKVIYVNPRAVEQLALPDANALTGYPLEQLMGASIATEQNSELQEATLHLPGDKQIDVDFQYSNLETDGLRLLRFTRRVVSFGDDNVAILQHNSEPENLVKQIIQQHELKPQSEGLLLQAQHHLHEVSVNRQDSTEDTKAPDKQVSLLLLDVFLQDSENKLLSVVSEPTIAESLRIALEGTTAKENHVSAISESRYAFLLSHTEQSQAYVITRKIMQFCLEHAPEKEDSSKTRISCTGSLLNLTNNSKQTLGVLVQHAITGLELVNSRGPDQAILLDVRRLLGAYPTE